MQRNFSIKIYDKILVSNATRHQQAHIIEIMTEPNFGINYLFGLREKCAHYFVYHVHYYFCQSQEKTTTT